MRQKSLLPVDHIVAAIDAYPLDLLDYRAGDIDFRSAVETSELLSWFGGARTVGDLDLPEAEQKGLWSSLVLLTDDPPLFAPLALALTKAILLDYISNGSVLYFRDSLRSFDVGGAQSSVYRSSQWRVLMASGLTLILARRSLYSYSDDLWKDVSESLDFVLRDGPAGRSL